MKERDITELVSRYNTWRQIYAYAGEIAPNEPDWDDDRLYFRNGYPNADWSAFILEATADGRYKVLHASTERRNTPIESLRAVFSQIEDAGKYIVYEVADLLRVTQQLEPLDQRWRAAGLDPRVEKVVVSERQAKYELRDDRTAYFLAYSGGIQPYNHILPLSYDQLDAMLIDGFPESITSRVGAEPR
jgi:hypothetical protein